MIQARRAKGQPGKNAVLSNQPDAGLNSILTRLRKQLKARGGSGIVAIGRKFRIIDDDGSGALSLAEFKKAMNEANLDLQGKDLQQLFQYFDRDGSGEIEYDEFLRGVVGPMSEVRMLWVNKAFSILDEDGSGVIDVDDIRKRYNVSNHPEVIRGAKTEDEALEEILSVFEEGGVVDGKVTHREFENYYNGISAGIDNDDYFELMMRNAWHISGGEGWAANSANLRVLVVFLDGSSEVICVKNDLALDKSDPKAIIARLKKQGVRNIKKVQLN
jgi:Ca2+-binding EF-hand superfamily protein